MAHEDRILVILEEIAQANRDLNNENRTLREELKKRDEENKRIIQSLENKIDAAVSSASESGSPPQRNCQRRRIRKAAVRIPAQCRVC